MPDFYFEQRHSPTLAWLAERMNEPAAGRDPVDKMLYFDIGQYLPYDLLVKIDIATMAHALEGRSPLLDYRMLELSARMPSRVKLAGGEKKAIFKQALEKLLPRAHLDRNKMGFGIPIHDWFRGELRELAMDVLTAPRVGQRGLLRPEAVRRMLDDHVSGRSREGVRIWALLFLEMWLRRCVDGEAA